MHSNVRWLRKIGSLSDATDGFSKEAIMTRWRFLSLLLAAVALIGSSSLFAQDSAPLLRIDVPDNRAGASIG